MPQNGLVRHSPGLEAPGWYSPTWGLFYARITTAEALHNTTGRGYRYSSRAERSGSTGGIAERRSRVLITIYNFTP